MSCIADMNLSVTDFEFLNDDGSFKQKALKLGGKTPAHENICG